LSEEPPPQVTKDLTDATSEELAAFALRKEIASLADELHYSIDHGLDADGLHSIVGLWEANQSEMTFESLVKSGAGSACDGCGTDVTPYDEDGRPMDHSWEWYMVEPELWETACTADGSSPRYLCIGCLEARIGRPLRPDDFSDLPVNDPYDFLATPRLRALLKARTAAA
jgi:hypothetical protein